MRDTNQKKIYKRVYFERCLNTPRRFKSSDLIENSKQEWFVREYACQEQLVSKRIYINSQIINTDTCDYQRRLKIFYDLKKIVKKNSLSDLCIPLLHGSYATGSTTNFSDVDIILILYQSTYSSLKKIQELKKGTEHLIKYIYKTDPFMHHGVNIIFKDDLLHYDESILPMRALKKSVSLDDGEHTLDIKSCFKCSMENNINYLRRYSKSLGRFSVEKDEPLDLYSIKSIVSGLFLTAVIFFQVKNGSFHYKGDCIEDAKEYFSKKNIFILEEFSEIRQEWPKKLVYNFFSFFLFSNWFVHPEYSKRIFYKLQKNKNYKAIYKKFKNAIIKDKHKIIEQINLLLESLNKNGFA